MAFPPCPIEKRVVMAKNAVQDATTTSQLVPVSVIDRLLATQLIVAWSGETGEERRLGWWRTDLTSEFGGKDLFRRLLPNTWEWAVLQANREAARKRDSELRQQENDPDRIVTLFFMGHEIDERVDERLQDLKRSSRPPLTALPALTEILGQDWNPKAFGDWIQGHGEGKYTTTSVGRRINGSMPESIELRIQGLVAACWPLSNHYSLPHYRSTA